MLIKHLITYFENEQKGAAIGILIGIILLLMCYPVWKRSNKNPLLKGLFYPLLFLSVFGIGGIYNIWNNTRRIEEFTQLYKTNPGALLSAERARIAKIDTWWEPLRALWAVLVLSGIILAAVNHKNIRRGIAIGLILIGIVGFVIDIFAKRNSDTYKYQLEQVDNHIKGQDQLRSK